MSLKEAVFDLLDVKPNEKFILNNNGIYRVNNHLDLQKWDCIKKDFTDETSLNIIDILKGEYHIKSKLTFYHTDTESSILYGLYLLGYRYIIRTSNHKNILISKCEPYETCSKGEYHACIGNMSNIVINNEEELFKSMKNDMVYEIKIILEEDGAL